MKIIVKLTKRQAQQIRNAADEFRCSKGKYFYLEKYGLISEVSVIGEIVKIKFLTEKEWMKLRNFCIKQGWAEK